MGCFSVEIEVANNCDVMNVERGRIKPGRVRRVKLQGVVDSAAPRLVLSKKVVEQLTLPLGDRAKVWYADKRHGVWHRISNDWLKMPGRDSVFEAWSNRGTARPKVRRRGD